MSERSPRWAPIEPLSPQAWQRVESAIFARLDDGLALSMPSAHASQHACATRRSLCYHWLISVALSVSAAAIASVVHRSRSLTPEASSERASEARAASSSLAVPLPSSEPRPVAPATLPVPVQHAPASVRVSTTSALDTSHAARSLSNDAASVKIAGTRRLAPRSDRETTFGCAAGFRSEDAARELTLYLALARGQDAEAANALYTAARLELDRGDPEAGILLLGEYSERFPDGENSIEVEALRAQFGALAAD